MSSAPEPLDVEVVIDTSPEAQAAYLEALKIVVRHIRDRREQREDNKLTPPRVA